MTVILFTVLKAHAPIYFLASPAPESPFGSLWLAFLKPLHMYREPIKSLRFKPDKVCQLVYQVERLKTGKVSKLASSYGKDN